jgi:hypothetical protein
MDMEGYGSENKPLGSNMKNDSDVKTVHLHGDRCTYPRGGSEGNRFVLKDLKFMLLKMLYRKKI